MTKDPLFLIATFACLAVLAAVCAYKALEDHEAGEKAEKQ